MIDVCAGLDTERAKGSNVCRGDSVTVRKGNDDAKSQRGDVDAVFCIARRMTGAAGAGNGNNMGRERWDDVFAVKSIN